jgi:hypothetical protein
MPDELPQVVDETIFQEPAGVLYHYTGQRGLLGILKDREVWASSIRHLNDTSEFELAVELAQRRIDDGNFEESARKRLRAELTVFRGGFPENGVYVFSLTENRDQLSQWRGYAPSGSGYAIGLAPHVIEHLCTPDDQAIGRCCYDEDAQARLVAAIVDDVAVKIPLWPTGSTYTGRSFWGLGYIAPFLKDKGYQEEAEWRVVGGEVAPEKICHREGESFIVPYLRWHLPEFRRGRPLFEEVVIGPTPHAQASTQGLLSLLRHHGEWCDVNQSKIPFRSW